ncbi:tigger transposable element-derived protein 6-like [Ornithodoros turicata]|uniref:tigger transposable element-derived protein 6-like n=1 Tax=Ornithodoros turicata TaxID=34597 RepID=UPI003138B5D9
MIRRVEHGEKKSSVAHAFGIPRGTLSTILKNKAGIKVKGPEQNRSGACRVHAPAYDKVEKALYSWFLDTRLRNIPVDSRMFMEKAKCFAMMFEEHNFCGGSGWLQRFKYRYEIVGKAVSGESECANNGDIENWLAEEWPEICAAFSPADIFNADETALFWQMLPNKTLDLRGSTCHRGKMSKVRVSILLAANMDGSVKLPLFVIGKRLVAAAENVCAVTEDDDANCLDATLRELSVFPGVTPPSVSATDNASVDDAVEAVAELTDADIVADIAGADEGDSTDDEEPQP